MDIVIANLTRVSTSGTVGGIYALYLVLTFYTFLHNRLIFVYYVVFWASFEQSASKETNVIGLENSTPCVLNFFKGHNAAPVTSPPWYLILQVFSQTQTRSHFGSNYS